MKDRIRFPLSALWLVGIIFSAIGAIYLPIGIIAGRATGELLFFCIFSGLGALFLGLGLVFLFIETKKRRCIREAFEDGNTVPAVVTEIVVDRSVRVNGVAQCFARCEYREAGSDIVHVYRSLSCRYLPQDVIGQTVDVYLNRNDDRYYYVDLSAFTDRVRFH